MEHLRTYYEIVNRAIQTYSNEKAIAVQRNGKYTFWTYTDFYRDFISLAQYLRSIGFNENCRALLIGANSPEWIIAFHSIVWAGETVIPVDPNLPENELKEIIKKAKPSIIFCDYDLLPIFNEFRGEFSFIKDIISLHYKTHSNEISINSAIKIGKEKEELPTREFSPNDPISILFTSGTTGNPKGAVLMQKNYCPTPEFAIDMMNVTTDDSVIAVLPLYHVFGFAATIAGGLSRGAMVATVSEINGKAIVKTINDLNITTLPAVPKMLNLILESIERNIANKGKIINSIYHSLLSISPIVTKLFGKKTTRKLFPFIHTNFGKNFFRIVSGGASISTTVFNTYQKLGFDIVEGYGLTETFGPITLCPITKQVTGSVGKVIGPNRIKIQNPDKDGWGEVLFSGESIFKGYLDDDEATQKVFDNKGWFLTGDRGKLDESGFLFLSGRLKDIIVLESGKNVYPEQLEEYYLSSPLIKEISIFPLNKDDRINVVAIIIPNDNCNDSNLIKEEMENLNKGRTNYQKVDDYVISNQELPKTSTQKVRKHLLPPIYTKLKNGTKVAEPPKLNLVDNALSKSDEYKQLKELISNNVAAIKEEDIHIYSNLKSDLNIDSLRFLDLITEIEQQCGCKIDEKALWNIETIRDLVKVIQNSEKQSRNSISIKDLLESDIGKNSDLFKDKYSMLTAFLLYISKMYLKIVWKLQIIGEENIPLFGSTIFIANHQSLADAPLIYMALPKMVKKRTYSLTKAEVFDSKLFSFLLSGTNILPIEREGDILTPLKRSYEALKKGKNIIIFPEGTRSKDGKVQAFKEGFAILMKTAKVPVVPITIVDSNKFIPKGKGIQCIPKGKNPITLIIDPPITLDNFNKEVHEEELALFFKNKIENNLQQFEKYRHRQEEQIR